jgi:threonine dehydrogenase-like Zn-dependent dehydrogenase
MMRSIRLPAPGELRYHDEAIPTTADNEKLIRVKAVGLCSSDLDWFSMGGIGDAKLNHLLLLGHEFAEMMEEDQRVAIDPAIPADTVNFVNTVIPISMRTCLCMIRRIRWHNLRIDGMEGKSPLPQEISLK